MRQRRWIFKISNTFVPDSEAWPSVGLPEDFRPLIAPGRGAFTIAGKRLVTHGGTTIDEMIVPLVRMKRRTG